MTDKPTITDDEIETLGVAKREAISKTIAVLQFTLDKSKGEKTVTVPRSTIQYALNSLASAANRIIAENDKDKSDGKDETIEEEGDLFTTGGDSGEDYEFSPEDVGDKKY